MKLAVFGPVCPVGREVVHIPVIATVRRDLVTQKPTEKCDRAFVVSESGSDAIPRVSSCFTMSSVALAVNAV
jgi:hypothetical protein